MNEINKWILLLLIILSGTKISQAQVGNDHLEPARGIFDGSDYQFEYYSKVRKILFKGLDDNPKIRFLTMPSFTPENVLQIDFDREMNKYYCIYHICKQMIWHTKKWKNVGVSKFSKEIDKQSAELIKSLYDLALSQTKFYVNEDIGLDGESYCFFGHSKSGMVWSPTNNTQMAELVSISYELVKMTREQNKQSIIVFNDDFQKRIYKLIDRLKENYEK